MARVNLFEFTSVISKESVSAADDKDVKVETIKDLPEQLKEDAPAVEPEVHVAPNDAKTSEPGPAEGGGDGTAVFEQAKEAEVELEVSDVNENLNRDQNGGREMDTVTDEVKANDGLSASDVSTSVEAYFGSQVPFLPKFEGTLDSHISVEAETGDKPSLIKKIIDKIIKIITSIKEWFTDIGRKTKDKLKKTEEAVRNSTFDKESKIKLNPLQSELLVNDGALDSKILKLYANEFIRVHQRMTKRLFRLKDADVMEIDNNLKPLEGNLATLNEMLEEASSGESKVLEISKITKTEINKVFGILETLTAELITAIDLQSIEKYVTTRLMKSLSLENSNFRDDVAADLTKVFDLVKNIESTYVKFILGVDKTVNEIREASEKGSVSNEEHTGEVSELETIDAGGAEEVGEADCLVMDLDDEPLEITGLTEVTEDGLDKAAELAEKAAEVETAVASVERYIGLLGRIEAEGKVLSPELRQAISWGLESIDAELFKSECVSLEALEGTIDDGDEPGVVKKGLSGKLKKLIEAGVKLFWRLVNAVGDIYQSLIADSTKIRQHLSDLRSKVKTLEGGQKFTMKNPHRLLVGEEFVGDSKAAIDTVSKVTGELLGTWPERLRKIVEKYSNMNKGKFAGLVDELNDAMKGSFRGFKSLSSQDRDHVPSGFLGADELRWSGILPGNRGVYTSINKSDKGLAESNVSDKITISFSAVPNEATNSGEVEVSTLTAGEATTIIRELEKLLNTLDETKREAAEFKKKSSDYIRSAVHDLLGMTGNGAEDQIAGVVLLNTINKTNETHRQYIGYVIGLVKAYMGYIHASLKAEHGDVIEG